MKPYKKKILFVLFLLQFHTIVFAKDSISLNQQHPKSGTVIFVHGFMRTKKNMSALERSFKKDGWRVANWTYPSKEKYIEEHSADLVDKMKQIAKTYPGRPISFVTHSMGGLLVRASLNMENCPYEAKIGRAVLIATPNRGSVFARKLSRYTFIRKMLGDRAGHQLMTTPLDGFDDLGDFPEGMPVLIISGTAGLNPMVPGVSDGKVALNETCLKTPHFHLTSFAGHSWICHTPNVIRKAKTFLSFQSIPAYKK